jgi:Tat protein secretion system quality control protein TatD with DNase activity
MHVRHTCEKVAKIKGISFEEAAEATLQNGLRFFGIPDLRSGQ